VSVRQYEVQPPSPISFGLFMPPYHSPRQNAALAIENDLVHVETLEQLGYDQVWFGEHHSGGYEIYPSPEIMIAAAAQRTSRIRLGTGVVSLPYHHPLMVADRIAFLDHLTRGRLIFGVGPGALPADSYMMGMDYNSLRGRMEQALDAILALLDGTEPITCRTEWFELREARLQLQSYRQPRVSMSVASALSPSGPRLAGRHGLGLLSIGGTSDAALGLLADTWSVITAEADAHGQSVSRRDWGVVGMMHVAPTEAEAIDETRYGLKDFYEYRHAATPTQLYRDGEDLRHEEIVERVNTTGSGVIGTPEMARAFLHNLLDRTGGFGTFLLTANDWADPEGTRRSWDLLMREVAPDFDGTCDARQRAFQWTKERKPQLLETFFGGIQKAKDSYAHERKLAEDSPR
jgi:limonene 1,2-monooxygenase